ncbi:MAG: hypothetical protein IT557_04055 [Alphaproteobacteria bacterium]|nr:hypothetical protein [Alphaproteobacteria bacterium]
MSLTKRRVRAIATHVFSVVPSMYPDAKFKEIDSGWAPGKNYTTCGGLPAYVARKLGMAPEVEKEGLGVGGLAGMRNAGLLRDAWVHHSIEARQRGEDIRPKKGDFYLLCSGYPDRHEKGCPCIAPTDPTKQNLYKGAVVEHVGVIISSEGTRWRTADAGQSVNMGMGKDGKPIRYQCAKFVDRIFDPVKGTLDGEETLHGVRPPRRLCGWLDIDKYPFLT